jgi:hypothetical protein
MKAVVGAAVLIAIALGTSACAGSHSGRNQSSTDALQLHESTDGSLPQPLRNFIHSIKTAGPPNGPVNQIDVYGAASREALVRASSGEFVAESPRELKQRFYLIVLHGHFACDACSGPAGAKPPHGTIETHVWSPAEGSTDFGISNSLPAAMTHLHRLATITIS